MSISQMAIFVYMATQQLEMGEKKTERKKIPRLAALPSPFYNMEADCFPVSKNAENNPDLP